MQKILGSHWKSSPKDWLLSLCLRPAADHGPYVAWQTQLISEHTARTETLSHAPVKAWPTSTPGGILICCDLLALVSRGFKIDVVMEGERRWREQRMDLAGTHPGTSSHGLGTLLVWIGWKKLFSPFCPLPCPVGWATDGKILPYHFFFFFFGLRTKIECLDHGELCHLLSWRLPLDKINTSISGIM